MSGITTQTVKTSTTVTVWIRTGADTRKHAAKLASKVVSADQHLTLVERMTGYYRFVIA